MNLDRSTQNILIEEGFIARDELNQFLATNPEASFAIEDALHSQGLITTEQRHLCKALATGIPFVDLKEEELDAELVKQLSHKTCSKHQALLIESTESAATIAMANPMDIEAIDAIEGELEKDIDPVWAIEADIIERITEFFGSNQDLEDILSQSNTFDSDFAVIAEEEPEEDDTTNLELNASDSPVIQFVNALLVRAIKANASDIHIEPHSKTVKVRFRIDGVLRDIIEIQHDMLRAVVSRIKVVAGLDIAERRIPQDGRCSMKTAQGEFDFRIATYPSVSGEKITIRVLDKSKGIKKINEIGIHEDSLLKILHAADQSQGLVLITGPTGSGKTTTLYSLLDHVLESQRQIITVEDPVEYQIDGITQANVNKGAGMTFAAGLRAILRADPDVILVGESRDPETAKTTIEAALTGHLVFTSLHANDSVQAVTRLIEMGIEEFLVSASVSCSVAQRLVRKTCSGCAKPYNPDPTKLEVLGLPKEGEYKKGTGCDRCGKTGYSGRLAVHEVMQMSQRIRKLLFESASADQIRTAAIEEGMITMLEDSKLKILQGLTTPDEILRVIALEDAA